MAGSTADSPNVPFNETQKKQLLSTGTNFVREFLHVVETASSADK